MNKTEFVAAVAETAGASKKDAENIINATLAQIEKCLLQATRYSLSVSALLKPVSVEREPQRIPVPARRSPFRQLRLRHLKQARLSRMPSISKPNYKAKGTAIEMIAVPFLNIYLLLHITEAQNIPSFTSKRQIPP